MELERIALSLEEALLFLDIVGHLNMGALAAFGSAMLADNE